MYFTGNHDRIYRLSMEAISTGNSDHYAKTGKPLGDLLSKKQGGIEAFSKMNLYGKVIVKVGNELFKEEGFFDVNPGTLDVFTFNFLAGSKSTCFNNPNSILISSSLAKKYFNEINVIGKELVINETLFTITGVFEDWPKNSHLDMNSICYSGAFGQNYEPQDWFNLDNYTYVLLDPSVSGVELNRKLEQLTAEELTPIAEASGIEVKLHAQPLKGLYFEAGLIDDVLKGNRMYVNAIAFAGLLVLLISALNYINLSLTQSMKRIKEISVKKILGITRNQLWFQSATESSLITLFVLVLSGILVLTLDEFYFYYTGFSAIEFSSNWPLILIAILFIFSLGLVGTSSSGIHFSFSNSLKNNNSPTLDKFKKFLLGFQFTVASIIIIATLTINKQIGFMEDKDLGFSKEQVLILDLPEGEVLNNRFPMFREKVKNFATIENASLIGGGALPGEDNGKDLFQFNINGSKEERVYNIYGIDENYFKLLNIEFASGRNFQAERISDIDNSVIINESLARSLNWEEPLGKLIWYQADQPKKVIGVVKNFHNKSLHNALEPIVFLYNDYYASKLLVKTSTSSTAFLQTLWDESFPDTPFSLTYFDQFLHRKYENEDRLASLLGFFSVLSLALSSMGLFAIFSLNMLQKKKEISLRKILGASHYHVLILLNKEFTWLVFISFVIAAPFAWGLMEKWLEDFAYRVEVDALIFIISAALTILVVWITVSWQSWKAALTNPVDALKSE